MSSHTPYADRVAPRISRPSAMPVLHAVLGAIARPAITLLSKRRQPRIDGRVAVSGLDGEVEIIRDRWGVPHIYASTERDLFFAQGFTHAQDRIWQMDLNRRTAAGRLSEIVGGALIETDTIARTLGFTRNAVLDLKNMPAEIIEVLTAYTDGVNAHISGIGGRLPVEFTLLRYRPDPWTVLDSLSYVRLLTWILSYGWYTELVTARLIKAIGPELAADLRIEYPSDHVDTLPNGIEVGPLLSKSGDSPAGGFISTGGGSNAWAVSGSRTTSGSALLANDPHLPLRLPSTWYENHLKAAGYHVTGVSFPGLPGVAIGHNEHIAWGMTVSFVDAQDVVVERFDPARPRMYQTADGWLEAESIQETIKVRRRKEPVTVEVLLTRNGPVLPQIDVGKDRKAVIRAMSLGPARDAAGFIGINRARNWAEFREACRSLRATQVNFLYADIEGNIGYTATGAIPVRASGNGTLPVEGWADDSGLVGEIPHEEMPHALNPDQGYLISANNRIVNDEYPHHLGSIWIPGHRANRIEEVIAGSDDFGVPESRDLQLDFTCLPGLQFADLVRDLTPDDPDSRLGADLLKSWDGVLDAASAPGAIYELIRRRLLRRLLEPALGPEMTQQVMGDGTHPLLASESEYVTYDTVILLRLLRGTEDRESGASPQWVERAGGTEAALEWALADAVRQLRSTQGNDPAGWTWGNMHKMTFAHAMGLRQPLDRVFNRGPFQIGGDSDTPWQSAYPASGPYSATSAGQSYRQIIDMGDLPGALAMYAPGQSGRLGSRHYDDLIKPWLAGEYHPMLWERSQVDSERRETLVLAPDGG
ncbi:MAG: penicillin acylase family protein [Chloroflexi bacterium]|nr:penicillin acylase family protein [Chloroflexota bacterium]